MTLSYPLPLLRHSKLTMFLSCLFEIFNMHSLKINIQFKQKINIISDSAFNFLFLFFPPSSI